METLGSFETKSEKKHNIKVETPSRHYVLRINQSRRCRKLVELVGKMFLSDGLSRGQNG